MAEITRFSTTDGDIHDTMGDADLIRHKIDSPNVRWLLTTAGWYVRCDKVVSVWTPGPDEPTEIKMPEYGE